MKKGIVLFIIGMLFSASWSYAGDSIKVTFLNPNGKGNRFWDLQTSFMQASANDLSMDLEVIYSTGGHRYEYEELAKKILTSSNKPDYLISIFKKGISERILQLAEKEGVRYFTINTDISGEEQKLIGKPREKFKYWIGQMIPDDTQAGYQLAKILIEKARKLNLKGTDGKIQILGISGSMDSSAALDRNAGLEKAIKDHPDTILHQIVFTNWDQEDSRQRVSRFLIRYPELNIIWCASDGISLGVVQAIEENGKIPGQHILTGGIDWSKEGLQAVKEGKMLTTLGGHFMEGGLALVLLYDYHHGKDFATESGIRITTGFKSITSENIQAYENKLRVEKWGSINFKKLSKVYNSKWEKYNFDLEEIFGE
ncbi:MAG: ABC transporter substrate-binding protein [Desulfamplus sp.]|nr:ABC transporter substrate-binding protein [Desulfamplus sp.]